MELTRTDAVFSRIAMVLFLCRHKSSRNDLKSTENYIGIYKKYWKKSPRQAGLHLSTRVGARLPTWARPLPRGPPGAPPTSTPTLYIHVRGEKNREKDSSRFTIRSRRQALKPLGRDDLGSVRGSGAANPPPSSSSTIQHHQFHDAHRRACVIPS